MFHVCVFEDLCKLVEYHKTILIKLKGSAGTTFSCLKKWQKSSERINCYSESNFKRIIRWKEENQVFNIISFVARRILVRPHAIRTIFGFLFLATSSFFLWVIAQVSHTDAVYASNGLRICLKSRILVSYPSSDLLFIIGYRQLISFSVFTMWVSNLKHLLTNNKTQTNFNIVKTPHTIGGLAAENLSSSLF